MAQGAVTGQIFQGVGAVQQGKAQHISLIAQDVASQIEYGDVQVQAKQLELQSAQREADRKEALNKVLASQNAMTGAKGTGFMGSAQSVMEADIAAAAESQRRDKFMSDLERKALLYRGMTQRKFDKMAKKVGGFSAFHNTISQVGGAAGGAASAAKQPS